MIRQIMLNRFARPASSVPIVADEATIPSGSRTRNLVHYGALLAVLLLSNAASAAEKPNIILVFADDISARELPLYGSSVWSPPTGGDTSDVAYRAQTPALDKMAEDGCWVETAWASVVCSPSRAMMMTGRYAHLHKWWNNKDKGQYLDAKGKAVNWPLYESSPRLIGHIAQQADYATYWAGKTQMAGDLREFGFDQGCFTPGNLADTDNPHTDFKLAYKKENGTKTLINVDSGRPVSTFQQHGWYWHPHVRLMKHPGKPNGFQWWPNDPKSESSFGVNTYGPDVELDFVFDFMDRQHADGRPFFVYHTSHLGHDAFDWLNPDSQSKWPGTPVVKWNGERYERVIPNITGDGGEYDDHGTVTDPGIHHHINYLDYQIWLYRNKLEEMGIADNTVLIFCADNGTSGYGKGSSDRQKGTHVPLIILAPGMTKQGRQNVLVNMSDMLPTIAELTGATVSEDYEINGESLVPFLYTDQSQHREWIYGYNGVDQIIRGDLVMKDGKGRWWDVSAEPDDLISFPEITDWDTVNDSHRVERDKLRAVLPQFNRHATEHDAPGVELPASPVGRTPKNMKRNGKTFAAIPKSSILFKDNFDRRSELGDLYHTGKATADAFTIVDGVLTCKQTQGDHGAHMHPMVKFRNADIQFDVRFRGGKSFNLVIDDKNDKTVHAGHICRVSFFPKLMMVGDDKTGAMNLKVREQRQRKDLPSDQARALEDLIKETRRSGKATIKPDKWHHVRVKINDDTMAAFLDGKPIAQLKSPGIAHPTKTNVGLTVNGELIDFDNLEIRSLAETNE